jgi:hypothetical protein
MTRSLLLRATLLYLAVRLVSGLLLWQASTHQVPYLDWTSPHPGYLDMTVLWDGSWYRQIAEVGYPSTLPLQSDGQVAQNAWAFFPLFPMMCRAVMAFTGLSFPLVGSTVSLLCGLGAALVIVALFVRRMPAAVALGAMVVWASFASSPSLQIAYTDSLGCLVVACWLWLVVRRHWLGTGLFAIVVGLSRPIAAPLSLVLAVAFVARWRRRREDPIGASEASTMGVAAAGTLLAVVLWPAIVGWRTGVPDAFAQTQASWRAGHTIKLFSGWLSITEWALRWTARPQMYAPVLLALVVAGLALAAFGPWAHRLGPELRAWCLAYPAYIAVAIDPFTSVFRYALPMFPVAAVLIGGARPDRPSPWWTARVAVLVAAGIVLQVVWINKLLVFHPPTDYPP